jgi:hypothetical protein
LATKRRAGEKVCQPNEGSAPSLAEHSQHLKDFLEDRRKHYGIRTKPLGQQTSRKKFNNKEIELKSEMDDFINAHLGFGCRRLIVIVFFGNDKTRKSDL